MLAVVAESLHREIHITTSTDARDGRVLSAMSQPSKVAHARLLVWGKWSREGMPTAYPAKTLLARVIEEGPHGAFSAGRPPISMPEDIETVDRIVGKLGDIDRRVLRVAYIDPWAPAEGMARKVRMGVREFQRVLQRARQRVYFGLMAVEEI